MNITIERPSFFDPDDPFGPPPPASARPLFGEQGPSFADLLDIINPLQHLPVIGTIYRALTGDRISDGARLAGGALYGGPIGLVAAMANVGMQNATGRDIGDTVMAALVGGEAPAAPTQTAEAAPTQTAEAAEPAIATLAAVVPAAGAAPAPAAEPAGRDLPQLSPEAFDALLRSVNAPPAEPRATGHPPAWRRPNPSAAPVAMPPAVAAAARSGPRPLSPAALDALSHGPGLPAVASPKARQAGLELHETLRAYAQQRGLAPAP